MNDDPVRNKARIPEIADASLLFGDTDPASPPIPASPSPQPGAPIEEYRVEDADHAGAESAGSLAGSPLDDVPDARDRPSRARGDRPQRGAEPIAAGQVDQIWSRAAEWGPNLAVIGATAFGFVCLLTIASGSVGAAFLVFLLGAATIVALSYPIVITLERPVRMTPEQALRDYFAALSHHLPHYRRMWLILSTRGREARDFGTYSSFRSFWRKQLSQLRGERIKWWTPLEFQVAEFKAEKSAGLSSIDAKYRVKVTARGQSATEPLATFRVATSMVRGPDQMWYLNDGTLPAGRV